MDDLFSAEFAMAFCLMQYLFLHYCFQNFINFFIFTICLMSSDFVSINFVSSVNSNCLHQIYLIFYFHDFVDFIP
jgi:hypothetical protein